MKFKEISNYLEKINNTSSRLEITSILYELFTNFEKENISKLIYFCKGNLDAKYKSDELNIGPNILLNLISEYLSLPLENIKKDFYELGDLGLVIEKNYSSLKQKTLFSKELSFEDVYLTFKKISLISGNGSIDQKQKLFKYILFNSDSVSAKYIVRFPLSFRLGFSDSTIIDALSLVDKSLDSKKAKELITSKYLIVSDLGLIADIIFNKGIEYLKELSITPFIPIKSQLCERAKSITEIIDRLSNKDQKVFAVDSKIDGFRQQVHKKGDVIKIFTRQESEVSDTFPDLVEELKKINMDFIIDCEAIGYDAENKKYHSFQVTMQRKRKYNLKEKSKELPLHLKVFDLLYLNGKEIYNLPFKERRKLLEKYFNISEIVKTTELIYTDSVEKTKAFFNNRLDLNFEGIICKDINETYKAGSRGYSWIKFKKSYDKVHDTVDAIIVGVFYGQGRRSELGIGAILTALFDSNTNKYYTVAKLGSGLSEDIIKELNIKFEGLKSIKKPLNLVSNITPDYYITPKITIEINFDEITRSSVHTACYDEELKQGLALRFPRLVRIRSDKENETNSLETLNKLYIYQNQ
jgi:DNA ligase-1